MIFLIIVFLFPVAIYCSILAAINRRAQPLMVNGSWDFAGLLFAISGFLLVTGPVIAVAFYQSSMSDFFLRGTGKDLPRSVFNVVSDRIAFWGVYYGIICGGAVALLWWRRRTTVIYNVQSDVFESVFTQVLGQLQVPWHRRGKIIYLSGGTGGPEGRPIAGAAVATNFQAHPVPRRDDSVMTEEATSQLTVPPAVTLDAFPLFWNVSLHWHGAGIEARRQEIEPALERALASINSEENPISGWLFGIAGLFFMVMIFATALVILLSVFAGNRIR